MRIKHMIGLMFIMSLSYPISIQLYIISCLYPILTIKRALRNFNNQAIIPIKFRIKNLGSDVPSAVREQDRSSTVREVTLLVFF